MYRCACIVCLVAVCAFPAYAGVDFAGRLDRGIAAMDSNINNLRTFIDNTDRIFSKLSKGQREEIARRTRYVMRQASLARVALVEFAEARKAFLDTGSGPISAGSRYRRLKKAITAFESYRAMFDSAVDRCFIDAPEPRYLRILRRIESIPWYRYGERAALRRELEKAFVEYSENFVDATMKAIGPRRDAFYHALKNLQYSGSGFDLGLQYRFDRAFYAYQAMFGEKAEPGYGVPASSEFPVDSYLSSLVVYRPTSYARRYSKVLDRSKLDTLIPDSYSDVKELPPEALSREARRIKELQELVSTYEHAAQRGDKTALDECWKAYHELRDRWDKVN